MTGVGSISTILAKLNKRTRKSDSSTIAITHGAEALFEFLPIDEIHIGGFFLDSAALISRIDQSNVLTSTLPISIHDRIIHFRKHILPSPFFFEDISKSGVNEEVSLFFIDKGFISGAIIPVISGDTAIGWYVLLSKSIIRWKRSVIDGVLAIFDSVAIGVARSQMMEDLPAVLDELPSTMLFVNSQGIIEFANQSVELLTGVPISSIIGTSARDVSKLLGLRGPRPKLRDVVEGRLSETSFILEHTSPITKHDSFILVNVKAGTLAKKSGVFFHVTPIARELLGNRLREARSEYTRLVHQGHFLIVRIRPNMTVIDVIGDTDELLGIDHNSLIEQPAIWEKLLTENDAKSFANNITFYNEKRENIETEIRIVHQETKETKWLLVRGVALFTEEKQFNGWEAVVVDITDKRKAEQEITVQNQRLQSLVEISRALQLHSDPSQVMLQGIREIVKATGADGGVGTLYDSDLNSIEIVASLGASQLFIERLSKRIQGPSLIRSVLETGRGFLVTDVKSDSRFNSDIARAEGIQSIIALPLKYEDTQLGCITLHSRTSEKFSQKDYDLVEAATNQISIALKRAEFLSSERRAANSMAVLYRLSHEVAKYLTPRDIGFHSFPIIQEEISCKRMWLGVMNEAKTHIVGHAGIGKGMRLPIQQVQIELNLRHDILDNVIKDKKPAIVESYQDVECSGLRRILKTLEVGPLIIVPLAALGKLVGILVLEPHITSPSFAEKKLPILSNMGTEIGTVILARQLEGKMAETEKMRMAGLLASGIAHNFNNLLQAVIGQASLIEMQSPKNSPALRSSQMIVEAANRGAFLIQQLLYFSSPDPGSRTPLFLKSLLTDAKSKYEDITGENISLDISLENQDKMILGDFSQLQKVFTNIITNSKEALVGRKDGVISISAHEVTVRSVEISPDLAPGLYMRIDISDNGIGMSLEDQARCFEPFFTTKESDQQTGLGFSGSGLGLASSYQIIRQHGGMLTLQSLLGRGTTFSMYLPLHISHRRELSVKDGESIIETSSPLEKEIVVEIDNAQNKKIDHKLTQKEKRE